MVSEEVLLPALRIRGSHIVTEQVELPDAEVPRQVDQLMSGVSAIVNVIRCLA